MSILIKKLAFLQQDCAEVLAQGDITCLEKLKNKKIFIAGGTGFVGIWTATLISYLNQHHQFNTTVFLLSRNPEVLQQTAPHLLQCPHVQIINKDIRNIFELPSDIHYVIHLACSPDSRKHASNPFDTVSIIGDGTKNLLSVARYCPNLENILYFSSAAIYGSQPLALKNITETFSDAAPKCNTITATYPEAKRFAETLCTIFRSQYRLPVVVARPFSFVGPFQSLDRPWAINNFMQDALQNRPIQILGDGKTIRSYLYGSDVAYWTLMMLLQGNNGETYNLGSDQEIGLIELANLITTTANVNSPITVTTDRSIAIPQTSRLIPSTQLAKAQLKVTVTVELKEAIHKTLNWNRLCNQSLK